MKNNLAAFLMLTMCVLYSVQYVLPLGLGDRAVGEILEVHLLACEGVVHDEPLLSAGAEHGGGGCFPSTIKETHVLKLSFYYFPILCLKIFLFHYYYRFLSFTKLKPFFFHIFF